MVGRVAAFHEDWFGQILHAPEGLSSVRSTRHLFLAWRMMENPAQSEIGALYVVGFDEFYRIASSGPDRPLHQIISAFPQATSMVARPWLGVCTPVGPE
jgi:hypothetical protein